MGRSAKEHCRPAQACDGGGMVIPSKVGMGAGQAIKPQSEGSSGMARANARKAAPSNSAEQEASRTPTTEQSDYEGKSGWSAIGQAGSDMVTEYKRRKKDGKSE